MPARTGYAIWNSNANRLAHFFANPALPVPAALTAWYRYQTIKIRERTELQEQKLRELLATEPVWRKERNAILTGQRRVQLVQARTFRTTFPQGAPAAFVSANAAVKESAAARTVAAARAVLADAGTAPQHRAVLEARVAHPEASLAELAQRLGCTKHVVSGRLRRALETVTDSDDQEGS